MKRTISIFFSTFFLVSGIILYSCKETLLSGDAPEIIYPVDALNIDLNAAEQPSFICVVNSKLGLKSIETFIVKTGDVEEKLEDPVTSFYTKNTYSLSLKPFYTEDMIKIKVVATDVTGQKTVSELPLTIVPMYDLPTVFFSDGSSEIDEVDYVENDPMPNIVANFQSEEDLKWALFYQLKGQLSTQINDTVFFASGTKEASVNLKETGGDEGDEYVFDKGTTAIKVKIVAGEKNKVREMFIAVNYTKLITLNLDQTEDDLNGIPVNGSKTLSGNVEAARPLQSITYQLYSREGVAMSSPVNVAFDSSKRFSFTLTGISENLGSVKIVAQTESGGTDEVILNSHVGYKYYRVLASLSGSTSYNHLTTPGCFFSAETGQVYDYCAGKENCRIVDVGFAIWSSNKDIRLNSIPNDYPGLTNNEKFKLDGGRSCSPNNYVNGSVTTSRDWEVVNMRMIGLCTVVNSSNFLSSTISKIKTETVPTTPSYTCTMVKDFADNPNTIVPCIYQTPIPYNSGNNKIVIIMYDKTESVNSSTPIFSKCWFVVKVEL